MPGTFVNLNIPPFKGQLQIVQSGHTIEYQNRPGTIVKYAIVVQIEEHMVEVYEVAVRKLKCSELQTFQKRITHWNKMEELAEPVENKPRVSEDHQEEQTLRRHERHSHIQAFSWVFVPAIIWCIVFWAAFIDANNQLNVALETEKGCFIDSDTNTLVD